MGKYNLDLAFKLVDGGVKQRFFIPYTPAVYIILGNPTIDRINN